MSEDKKMRPFVFPSLKKAGHVSIAQGGMELRDYFAAQAMQAAIISTGSKYSASSIAKQAYIFADSMIEERTRA